MRRIRHTAAAVAVVIGAGLITAPPLLATTHAEARDTLCDTAPSGTFSDVSGVHVANINCVVAFGISQGTSQATFNPHAPLRRDHLATLLVNFLTLATGTSYDVPTTNPFRDVAHSVHADNIAIAASLNLTKGVTATKFAPQRNVTRDQFASLLVNTLTAAGHPLPTPTSAPFNDMTANVHAANVARLTATGIVSGTDPKHFNPTTPITRQQAATLLINGAAELHRAEMWDTGPLEADSPSPTKPSPTKPAPTVQITAVELNSAVLSGTDPNTAENDPLIITGTATADESTIVTVQAKIDEGTWINATATSGSFDSATETFRIVLQDITNGTRELTLRAIDADGLSSELATFTLDVSKPAAAVLVSSVTDLAENRIMLTFDQSVNCADTAVARSAWQFVNASLHAPTDGQASGAPDSINPLVDSPTMCALNYTSSGIRVSDYGTVSYTRPDPDHAVRTETGQLAQTVGATVVDLVDPQFLSVTANTQVDASRVVLAFNKPVRCSDITSMTFLLSIASSDRSSDIENVLCSSESELVSLQISGALIQAGETINVSVFTDLFGASGHGQVSFGAERTGVAT
ncbi:MAG: S-layer homology domain-containing protein [Nitriliruptoraceae bacterium]